MLMKNGDEDDDNQHNRDIYAHRLDNCLKQIHKMIKIVEGAIIKFYNINIKALDLKKDLINILATNLILTGKIYFLVYNLYALCE